MITWRNPAAWAGLAALAVPIVIHMLRRQRARRMPFPSLRFVERAANASVRPRTPSDLVLLALRLAILLLAVAAAAQPVVLTNTRLRGWNAGTERAFVIDRSESMRPFAAELRERIEAEAGARRESVRIESDDLAAAIRQAASRLDAAPPARREVVVFSDFPSGSIDAAALASVPASAGIRFVSVGTPPAERRFVAAELTSGARIEATLTGAETSVTIAPGSPLRAGLRLLAAPADDRDLPALMRALDIAGTPAPSQAQPLVVAFDGASPPPSTERIAEPWMRRTALRLLESRAPISRVAAAGPELLIEVDAAPSTLDAAAAVRAALFARAGSATRLDEEILRIPARTLSAWTREAPEVGPEIARRADVSDARWAWLVVLLLLAVEGYVRRTARPRAATLTERANAA